MLLRQYGNSHFGGLTDYGSLHMSSEDKYDLRFQISNLHSSEFMCILPVAGNFGGLRGHEHLQVVSTMKLTLPLQSFI